MSLCKKKKKSNCKYLRLQILYFLFSLKEYDCIQKSLQNSKAFRSMVSI